MSEKMLAFAYGGAVQTESRVPQRIEYSITGSMGTPLPTDLRPAPVFETGTGRLEAAPGPADVVRAAGQVTKKAGVLGTTPEGNALVDELLSTHTQGLAVRRPLERRPKK